MTHDNQKAWKFINDILIDYFDGAEPSDDDKKSWNTIKAALTAQPVTKSSGCVFCDLDTKHPVPCTAQSVTDDEVRIVDCGGDYCVKCASSTCHHVMQHRQNKRAATAPNCPEIPDSSDYEEVLADHRRLVRELDVALNGIEGAAKQASLCDIVSQVKDKRWKLVSAATAPKNCDYPDDGMPCVCCGKPSHTSTPDDAEMCHKCFGEFNATEHDNLKKYCDAVFEVLEDLEDCPFFLDQATVPKGKTPDDVPEQAVINVSISWAKVLRMREALAAHRAQQEGK